MSDITKLCTEGADFERLLEALRQLQEAGVKIIDDQSGRPKILSLDQNKSRAAPLETPIQALILDQLENWYEIEVDNSKDPYNYKP